MGAKGLGRLGQRAMRLDFVVGATAGAVPTAVPAESAGAVTAASLDMEQGIFGVSTSVESSEVAPVVRADAFAGGVLGTMVAAVHRAADARAPVEVVLPKKEGLAPAPPPLGGMMEPASLVEAQIAAAQLPKLPGGHPDEQCWPEPVKVSPVAPFLSQVVCCPACLPPFPRACPLATRRCRFFSLSLKTGRYHHAGAPPES